ncbi:MAG: serine hydrolase [Oscillospiraceae bacterium]|nr:serine hydrolase [Oscillospiraceae bacterium]
MKLFKKMIIAFLAVTICSIFVSAAVPELVAETAVLIDAETGQVLCDKEMHKQMHPASITKVITVITALENLELSDTITMSRKAVSLEQGSSHIALDEGEEITVEQAIYAAFLKSANDACNGLAEAAAGSIEDFTALMNETAKRAGALNSNFINAHGYHAEEHLTTAYDMAMICRYALQNEDFARMFGEKTYTMPPNNKKDESRYFINQHWMINGDYEYDGVIGGKPGYTTPSRNTLITVAERDGRRLIAVVLKCPKGTQYEDTEALFDYGFDELQSITLTSEDLSRKYGYTLDEEVAFLAEKGIGKENLVFEFSEVDGNSICHISSPDGRELTEFSCKKIPEPEPEERKNSDKEKKNEEDDGISFWGVLLWIVLIGVLGFGLFVLWIYLRKRFGYHRKRRNYRGR